MAASEERAPVWTGGGDVELPNGRLRYVELGSGSPVVFLHKLGGWADDWRQLAARLGQTHRCIAINLPGHGGSVVERGEHFAYPLEQSASDVLGALSVLGIARASFIGNSLGGCVAMDIASRNPDRVEKLVLISTAMTPAATREQIEKGEVAERRWYDEQWLPIPRSFEEMTRISGIGNREVHDEMNASRAVAGLWIHWSERGVGAADLTGMWSKITAPTLLLNGDRDPLGERFAVPASKVIPNSRLAVIPDCGRFPQQEQPEACASVIAEFLRPAPHR